MILQQRLRRCSVQQSDWLWCTRFLRRRWFGSGARAQGFAGRFGKTDEVGVGLPSEEAAADGDDVAVGETHFRTDGDVVDCADDGGGSVGIGSSKENLEGK